MRKNKVKEKEGRYFYGKAVDEQERKESGYNSEYSESTVRVQ